MRKKGKEKILSVINKDWDTRRARIKESQRLNSQQVKSWKAKQGKHPGGKNPPNGSPCTVVYTTLSLLVAVTYAREP